MTRPSQARGRGGDLPGSEIYVLEQISLCVYEEVPGLGGPVEAPVPREETQWYRDGGGGVDREADSSWSLRAESSGSTGE